MHHSTRDPVQSRPLQTVRQTAQRIGASERSVRRWIAAGQLPVIRLGRAVRIDPDRVDAILAAGGLLRPGAAGK